MPRRTLVFLLLTLGAGSLSASPSAATAAPAAPRCALVAGATAAGTPSAGAPCWSEVVPYPFGADGEPVDPDVTCPPVQPPGPSYTGDPRECYLAVDSFAFRAWNRGLAATGLPAGGLSAFGVWLYNGTRWFPDPTFPGQTVCNGNTVLWAGKRDYWLIGSRTQAWPSICRYDGVNLEWTPLAIPFQSLAKVPLGGDLKRLAGALNAGACFAWDNCWFFGSYGVVVHWDGVILKDASPDFGSPDTRALRGWYTGATSRTTPGGQAFGLAVSSTGGPSKGQQTPAGPDGTPPPLLFGSSGGAFAPLPLAPPTTSVGGDPYRTDLVAVDADAEGRGWVAGNPVGTRIGAAPGGPTPTERRLEALAPAPLMRVTRGGLPADCPALGADRFSFSDSPTDADAYLWSTVSAVPGSGGGAWAGGQIVPTTGGLTPNDDRSREPVLVQASCDAPPKAVRFRVPDPTWPDRADPPLAPADRGGWVSSVAANATNDAWAATSEGRVTLRGGTSPSVPQRPRLYHLTDTGEPLAPRGDDDEARTPVFEADPPIIVELPPDPEPEVPAVPTVTQPGGTTTKRIRLKPAVYAVRSKVSKPRHGTVTLVITFRVRRPVTIGLQALRRRTVVGSTGLRRFKGDRGRLQLRLNRRRWPTRIRFVSPVAKKPAVAVPSARLGAPR